MMISPITTPGSGPSACDLEAQAPRARLPVSATGGGGRGGCPGPATVSPAGRRRTASEARLRVTECDRDTDSPSPGTLNRPRKPSHHDFLAVNHDVSQEEARVSKLNVYTFASLP
eukprot:3635001-Rhodomonas_salina.1